MTVRELTTVVAAAEYDCNANELDYKQRKRVYTSLVQTHLPSMARNGVIDYDKDRGSVAATPAIDTFEPYLDGGASINWKWSARLLSLTAVFATLSVVLFAGVLPAGTLSATGVATAATLGLGALAAAYALRTRRDPRTVAVPDGGQDSPSAGSVVKDLLLFWR